jgi:putative addiction module component (TIGR02574 family)
MTQSVDQLLQQALALSDDEQLQLVAALVAAVDERGPRPFDDSWLEVIRRRSDEFDAELVQPIPWSKVNARARSRETAR